MIFLLSAVAVFIIGYMVWNNEDGRNREVRIVTEYQAINHPEGAKVAYYELNRKIIKRWINSRYIYPIDNDEVKKYYDQELVSKGWRQIPYNSKPGDVAYRYIKDNLKLVIGLNKDNSWTLFMAYVDAKY